MTTRTITAYEHTCNQTGCGHTWTSFEEDPARCPKCHSTAWKTGEKRPRGRPRTLPAELSEDVRAYNREYQRKRRARTKINPAHSDE